MGLHGGVGDSRMSLASVGPGRVVAPFTRCARNLVISPACLHIIIIRIRVRIITSAYGDRAISIQSSINQRTSTYIIYMCIFHYDIQYEMRMISYMYTTKRLPIRTI